MRYELHEQRRKSRISPLSDDEIRDEFRQEFGDAKAVKRVFGLTESFTYYLWTRGHIRAVLARGRGRTGGKRLYVFDSIREYLAKCAELERARPKHASKTTGRPRKEAIAR